mgnify:CR=1 FL=1
MDVESNYAIAIAWLGNRPKKLSRQFFNQWEAKPKRKPLAPCMRDYSRALIKLQVIAKDSDWFIALFAPVVIGQCNYFGIRFSIVISKPL